MFLTLKSCFTNTRLWLIINNVRRNPHIPKRGDTTMMTLKQALNVLDKQEMVYIYEGDKLNSIAILKVEYAKVLGVNGIVENMSAGVDDKGIPYIAVTLKENTYC